MRAQTELPSDVVEKVWVKELLDASRNGNVERVSRLLEESSGKSLKDARIVEAAVLHGHLLVVKALHKGGWTMEPPYREETSLLRGVIEANRYEMLHYLLELGWDVSRPIDKPRRETKGKRISARKRAALELEYTTLLHDACLNASVEIVARLIWAGADLATKDSRGMTALDSALQAALQGASHDQLKTAFLFHIQKQGAQGGSDLVLNNKLEQAIKCAEKHPRYISIIAETTRQLDARLEAKAKDAQAKDVPFLHKALNAVRLAYRTLRPVDQVATGANANQARPLALWQADNDTRPPEVEGSAERKAKSCTERSAACRAATQGLTSMQYCSDKGPLYCPLSQVLLTAPVMAADGGTYQRAAIKGWIRKCCDEGGPIMSPRTAEALSSTVLLPIPVVQQAW